MLQWLREADPQRLQALWATADAVRRQNVGAVVHLRGLVEISNHCVRCCTYCGLRAANTRLQRYRLTTDAILGCARQALKLGYGTVVLQAGEDPAFTRNWVAGLVRQIKSATGLAVTLSLGEQDVDTLRAWRDAGADRYLLRFETSNRALFERIHPPRTGTDAPTALDRIALLPVLRELGFEVGSGVMIGIPGQSYGDLADDIELFRSLDLDMIGVGPFLPHPDTPLGSEWAMPRSQSEGQVPNTELMTYKVIALARLVCPDVNIPSTTALATLNRASGRELGLQRGANVVMPNLTPPKYRPLYEVYPAKACLFEEPEKFNVDLGRRIRALGRELGSGPGTSANCLARKSEPRGVLQPQGREI
jgi:biotin synthase